MNSQIWKPLPKMRMNLSSKSLGPAPLPPPVPLHLQPFLLLPPDNLPPSISFTLGKLEHSLVFLLGSDLAMNCATAKQKKYYCQICGNATGKHNSTLTHVCHIHLNIVLGCHYCDFASPSFSTLKKHVSDKHTGLPVQATPPSEEQKLEMTVLTATLPSESLSMSHTSITLNL